jgi:hypothetical protein
MYPHHDFMAVMIIVVIFVTVPIEITTVSNIMVGNIVMVVGRSYGR